MLIEFTKCFQDNTKDKMRITEIGGYQDTYTSQYFQTHKIGIGLAEISNYSTPVTLIGALSTNQSVSAYGYRRVRVR